MPLTRDSVLHYWSARYGPVPILGGKPVHSRSSAAKWVDGQGIIQDAIVNTPRFEHATISSERRPVMRLERAETNYMPYSEDLASWATKSNCTIGSNAVVAPDGTVTADKIVVGSAGTDNQVYHTSNLNPGAGGKFTILAFVRKHDAPNIIVGDRADAAYHNVNVRFSDGAIAQSTGVDSSSIRALGGGWYMVLVRATATNAHSIQPFVSVSNSDSATDFQISSGADDEAYAWGVCVFSGHVDPSYIKTPGTSNVASAADVFYWDFAHPPQAMVVYARFVERGNMAAILSVNARIFSFSDASSNDPRFLLYAKNVSGAGRYAVYYANGASGADIHAGATPSIGDTVEVCATLYSNGSVDLCQSINGGVVTAPASGGPYSLPAAWSAPRLYANSDLPGNTGLADFAELKVVKQGDVVGATQQAVMDELRAFELSASGEVIS